MNLSTELMIQKYKALDRLKKYEDELRKIGMSEDQVQESLMEYRQKYLNVHYLMQKAKKSIKLQKAEEKRNRKEIKHGQKGFKRAMKRFEKMEQKIENDQRFLEHMEENVMKKLDYERCLSELNQNRSYQQKATEETHYTLSSVFPNEDVMEDIKKII